MITLVIKGSRSDALNAALKHNVFLHRVLEHRAYEETRAEVFKGSADQILDWFREAFDTPAQIGDLLWYSGTSLEGEWRDEI